MIATDKRSLIFESVAVTRIDIHPTEEEPDRHVIHMATGVSRTITIREVPNKLKSSHCSQDKVLTPSDARPGRHPGLPHSPSNKPPWSREGWFDKVVTSVLCLPSPIKLDKWSVQIKTCHSCQNDAVLNRHRLKLPYWNLRIATTVYPPFPFEWSIFSYLPRPVTSTIQEHKLYPLLII
jgi:hypothetical protein